MQLDVKVPSPGESIREVEIASWLKADGDLVRRDDVLCDIESDKATLTIHAEASGKLTISVPAKKTVPVGSVIARIDTAVLPAEKSTAAAIRSGGSTTPSDLAAATTASPAAAKIMGEKKIDPTTVAGSGKDGRITKQDVIAATAVAAMEMPPAPVPLSSTPGAREFRRVKMTSLRRTLAERLVAVKNQTAMLTTFNEVDMSQIIALRKQYKESFQKKYQVGLGFMSFFVRAIVESLREWPELNAMIEKDEIVYHDYVDIGVAVSAPRGLMVPVIRNAEQSSFAQIEIAIRDLAEKARQNKLTIDEMTGGTFTLTNGGIFGSMLSTPILNPPQSGILGMHHIVERPVAVSGEVVIRPVMYVAMSYDHRIVDGREAVSFLVGVKQRLEDPSRLLLNV